MNIKDNELYIVYIHYIMYRLNTIQCIVYSIYTIQYTHYIYTIYYILLSYILERPIAHITFIYIYVYYDIAILYYRSTIYATTIYGFSINYTMNVI